MFPKTYGEVSGFQGPNYISNKIVAFNKVAYIERFDEVYNMYTRLRIRFKTSKFRKQTNNNMKYFSISKDSLLPSFRTKTFYHLHHNLRLSFSNKLLQLSETGLKKLWLRWEELWKRRNVTVETASEQVEPKGVSLLDCNVREIFILYVILILTPILLFFGEQVANQTGKNYCQSGKKIVCRGVFCI